MLTDIAKLTESPGELKRRPDGANYHDGETIVTHLNYALGPAGWDWCELERGYDADADEVWVIGRLTARIVVEGADGAEITLATTKQERGWQAVERRRNDGSIVSLGNNYKAADTDALKRCARLLGVGLDAWSKAGAERARQAPPPRPAPPARPAPSSAPPPAEPLSPAGRLEAEARYVDLLARAQATGFKASWTSADHAAWSDIQLGKYSALLELHVSRQEGSAA